VPEVRIVTRLNKDLAYIKACYICLWYGMYVGLLFGMYVGLLLITKMYMYVLFQS